MRAKRRRRCRVISRTPRCLAIEFLVDVYFTVWRLTWITNLKNALSQAFSVKLRAVALTSAMTIFSRTRHGQPGRLSCAHNTLASDILAIRRLNEECRAPVIKLLRDARGKKKVLHLLKRIGSVQISALLFF